MRPDGERARKSISSTRSYTCAIHRFRVYRCEFECECECECVGGRECAWSTGRNGLSVGTLCVGGSAQLPQHWQGRCVQMARELGRAFPALAHTPGVCVCVSESICVCIYVCVRVCVRVCVCERVEIIFL